MVDVARVGGQAPSAGAGESHPSQRKRARRSGCRAHRCLALDDAEDVALLHDEQLLSIDLDLGARPFPEQNAVTFFDVERNELAAFVPRSGTGGNDLALHRLFLGRVGDDDAASSLHVLFDAAHDDAVVERAKLHGLNLTVAETRWCPASLDAAAFSRVLGRAAAPVADV